MAERNDNPSNRPPDETAPEVRAPAPHSGGPLSSSGAALPPEKASGKASGKTDKPDAPEVTAPAEEKAAAKPEPSDKSTAAPEPPKAADAPKAEPADKAGAPPVPVGAKDLDSTQAAPSDKTEVAAAATQIDLDKPTVVTTTSASGRRVTRVLRHANPIRAARTAGRSTRAWAKRPTGRLLIPAIAAVLLIAVAGTAGAYLVPKALESGPALSARPGFSTDPGGGLSAPAGGAGNPAPIPSGVAVIPPNFQTTGTGTGTGARPADALAGWAQGVGTRVGIPVVAVQAYGYAELVAAKNVPTCHLSWTTIAAIAKVESDHGSANGAVLNSDGSVQPPIFGLPLDGKGGRMLIRDTDQGTLDQDTQLDRAVGPLQFIPTTWKQMQVDADNSGTSDPNDIDDAALAAALYLCQGGRDLAKADSWWDAILSYNAVRPYAQKVFDAANDYGQRSRV